MKFTDGFWQTRTGVEALYAQEAYDLDVSDGRVTVTAPTRVIARRGDTLNRPALTVSLWSPAEGVVGVRIENHTGGRPPGGFELPGAVEGAGAASLVDGAGVLQTGALSATITPGAPWSLRFASGERTLTSAGPKSVGHMRLTPGAAVPAEPTGATGFSATGLAEPGAYTLGRLDLGVGELVYGLGERFGPVVKNGQSVDIWNADGGTSSEQSYKNVPFYVTNRGYGVLVNHQGHVSFEVGSEAVEQVQFSVPGEVLEYFVIDGPTPADVLERYTALTGRPPQVPDWSYGLWLSTSFTTDYDEATVNQFIDGMVERDLPLSVFHFDCFWMREFHWTDFIWDQRTFPDPEGMLERLHGKGLRVSAWINPYIAQRSALFAEAKDAGYLVLRPDGAVWQWDMWQAGMALVDFTNPAATRWFQDKLRGLLRQGVDALKTDFGERIPTEVVWYDGADPVDMHNWYTHLYNRAVYEVLVEERGEGEAVLFARSATAGGQTMPVHWGGDSSSTFTSMAETLRGGLSLAMSGFGFWSHDIGGFEGKPDPEVFKRWVAFGLLSSHSRLHGSTSYRVPWAFDTGEEEPGLSAVDVMRRFLHVKLGLMPYLAEVGRQAHERGLPFMRPMPLVFPEDPTCAHLDRQYMIGDDLLVAPVLAADGHVEYYLPAGTWTHHLTGEVVEGGAWRREQHEVDSLPLWVRGGALLVTGHRADRAEYDHAEDPLVTVAPGEAPFRAARVIAADGTEVVLTAELAGAEVRVVSEPARAFRARWGHGPEVVAVDGQALLARG